MLWNIFKRFYESKEITLRIINRMVSSAEKKKLFAEDDISKLAVIKSNDTVGRKVLLSNRGIKT